MLSLSTLSQAESLLYVGLTDTGWQVFQRSLESKKDQQLTKSVGDKRTPVYSSELSAVVYKGPKGRIWSVNDKGEENLLVDIESCGDFTLDGGDIYFTRLVTGNPQRQQLWKAGGEYPTQEMELIFRPEQGSLRQIQFRAGRFLATHIWTVGQEQVVIIDLSPEPSMRPLTPQKTIASYPRWVSDIQVVISQSDDQGNYDLHLVDVQSGNNHSESVFKPLTKTNNYSEFAVAISADGETYYSERLNEKGQWSIVNLNPVTGESTELNLERQAKEPSLVTP